jgi:hypothetical protein
MSNKIEEVTTAAEPSAKATKTRAAKKPARARAKTKKTKTSDAGGYDFVGKVESIVVRGGGDAGAFEFGLRGRHGARQAFKLRTSDSFALAIMAPIVTAAHATETKIGVRVAPAEAGEHYVVEVASRPKLRKPA